MANGKKWTAEEDAVLRQDLTHNEAAQKLGRTHYAVLGRRRALAIEAPAKALKPETTLDEDVKKAGNEYWHSQYAELKGKYQTLLKNSVEIDRLVEVAERAAPKAYSPRPMAKSRTCDSGKAQSAVLLLTDTHVGAEVSPKQTLGFGGYNFEKFLKRLKFLEDGVTSILNNHVATDVPELVICLGGDMLHGNLNHAAEVGQTSTLFQQYYGAGHALSQFVRNVAPLIPKVRIYTVVGNHTRWGTQRKMPTDNRYSNLDMFLYAYMQALTKDLSNVEWNLNAQPFSVFDVQNFKFHLSHGDHLRGGDKALGIPNHAVGRMVSSTTQLYGKHDMAAPHYYLVGHLHRTITLPHARGSVIVNGGFPGLDGFGLSCGFSPVDPTQTFFFVHPRYGKTATYELQLKHGDSLVGDSYDIPEFEA